MNHPVLAFDETVRQRSSVRAFLPTPLSDEQIRAVLQDAQYSPSNCNTQPWHVHVVSGETKTRLGKLMTANDLEGSRRRISASPMRIFTASISNAPMSRHAFTMRQSALPATIKSAAKRLIYVTTSSLMLRTPRFCLCHPLAITSVWHRISVCMRRAFLLSLTARGFAGIPQTLLGFHADMIRRELGVSDAYRLLFGISFGYADTGSVAANTRMPRVPVEESVVMHG